MCLCVIVSVCEVIVYVSGVSVCMCVSGVCECVCLCVRACVFVSIWSEYDCVSVRAHA